MPVHVITSLPPAHHSTCALDAVSRHARQRWPCGVKALFSTAFDSPTFGYAKFIDVDTWVDRLLLFELGMNSDGLKASMYFYKPYASLAVAYVGTPI